MQQTLLTRQQPGLVRRTLLRVVLAMPLFFCQMAGLARADAPAPVLAPADPTSVLLSPAGAVLEVQGEAPLSTIDGMSVLQIVLPGGAENLQLSVPGHTVLRWSAAPQILEPRGAVSRAREELLARIAGAQAQLAAVRARQALWQSRPQDGSVALLEERDKKVQELIPDLSREATRIDRRLKLLQEELNNLPASPALGQKISIVLHKAVTGAASLPVRYSYSLANCGWRPVYEINARPAEGKGVIDVRLMAEVWQFTGMDWRAARLTLSTGGQGSREPAPLPDWVVESAPQIQPRAAAMNLRARKEAMPLAAAAPVQDNAPVRADAEGVYAVWHPAEPGLMEGRARLQLAADAWQAPLRWLARPVQGDNRVWLTARCDVPAQTVWPQGQAEYSVDGQSVGQGSFAPRGGEVTLFFGADPRVSVQTVADSKKRGESGFIDTSKNWTWAWTYVVANGHTKPVTVRLERPAPQIVDQGVSVRYDDAPPSKKNEKEHMLFWDVQVPAAGKAEVRHSVTISSPTKLPLLPDAP
ncbi:DUF4139 domain-containing protein [uncultured Desulfovibrio sp.]|uniref:DUF4139 domain-containing protein n=1 Tax=uncultured Desulfovibrio sp. TaxID=167968 RepID=UPI00260AA609|nr:DUF4139 domain-containing protein [uncultured Desulfovibrio sp.]